jgi:pyruvate/2-oxoglutarate dehydrogenase complex dihydrolipoamide acyltransferase (E2) component
MTLKLPKLAVSMQSGTVVEWLAQDGAAVVQGQPLYVVESEKSSAEIESPFAGTLTIVGAPGTLLAVGTSIAYIDT